MASCKLHVASCKSQVTSCKWAQVLRAKITNGEDVLLKMDLAAGHFSASDRYKKLRETAFDYAWLLDQLGKVES